MAPSGRGGAVFCDRSLDPGVPGRVVYGFLDPVTGRTYTGALSYYGNSGGGTLSASADSDGIWKKDSHIGSGLQGDGVS